MSGHPPSPPQPPLPGSRTPLDPPSPASVWVADNWHSVIFGAVTTQFLHFRYLNSRHKPDPNPVKNARFWAGLGGAWMVSYLGIITVIAISQARVDHFRHPDNRNQYRQT
ncbi:hypothetical protein CGCSCA4_v004022 [Colletotrichum siamense]|uniref:Uncharacterized protein n=1 Tax=Colletotrichum siamense TaxID=690259 RepID=A0A9P5EZR5_COLSI|nr:hypothetical protein CGCSCA4_v004022 [Colletotrichum siamense]KAF4862550.1 hypothetical protein CGCSCA2_v003768 [Colletotrichum siamense]